MKTSQANQTEGFIDDIAISHVTITISKEVEVTLLDLGSVTLSCEGREYILDTSLSWWDFEDGVTEITCGLKTFDEDDIFEDCKFDLTRDDLLSSFLSGTIFVGDEESNRRRGDDSNADRQVWWMHQSN